MTPERFAELRHLARLSLREVGTLTGYSYGAVCNWANGAARVPPRVAAWLEAIAPAVDAIWRGLPPPSRRPQIKEDAQ